MAEPLGLAHGGPHRAGGVEAEVLGTDADDGPLPSVGAGRPARALLAHRAVLAVDGSPALVFIGGVPMNPATKRSAGVSYTSRGVPTWRQPPVVEDGDPVGHRHRLHLVVGDVDERRAQAPMEVDELGPGLGAQLGVEVGERLVHEEHRGPGHHGAGQGDPLALPAGQRAGLAVEVAAEAEHPGRLVDALLALGAR